MQHKPSHLKTKKVFDSAQEPTEKSKPGSTDVIAEFERVQTSQPVRKVPEIKGQNNGSLLSPNRNNISFLAGPNKSSSLPDEINTLN